MKKIRESEVWQLYHQSIEIKKGVKLYEKAIRYGYKESDEVLINELNSRRC